MFYRGYTSFNNYMRVSSDCAALKLKADNCALRCEELNKASKEYLELFEKSQKISLDSESVAKQLKELTSLLERCREDGYPKV